MEAVKIILVAAVFVAPISARPQFDFGQLFGGGQQQQQQQVQQQQQPNNRFNGVPSFQQNTGTFLSGAGFAGTGLLAFHNIQKGNDKLSLKPSLGGYFDANGNFIPTLQAGVQLGEGVGSTSLNVGGGLKNGELTPVVSTGVNVLQADGSVGAQVGTGFELGKDNTFNPIFGGNVHHEGVGVGLGSVSQHTQGLGFGRRRR